MTGLGRRPAKDLAKIEFVQVATEPVAKRELKSGKIDLAILDGEAAPAGGLGIARNAKDEVFNCPPIIVLIQRSQDAWLATWSKAEGVVPMPIDPVVLIDVATTLLRRTDNPALQAK
jgi:DNA-binding response OmpR family regulator